ncbi:MAG: DUF4864 domain-containing protein [Gammaproteobacteria bacterium]|nr:DUF4864 domain-containing protein [Gammaproteobacteria bacterium]
MEVADNHLAALRAGDVSLAYDHTSKVFRKATPLPAYKKFIAAYPILGQHEEFSAGDREFDGDTGSVEGTITSSEYGTATIKFIMVKDGDNWKIQGFNLE